MEIRLVTDFVLDEDIAIYAQGFDHNVRDAAKDIMFRIIPDLLDELGYEPPGVKYPIQWTSDKQRRFVMAKLREEGNLPYQRTHQLANSWFANIKAEGNSVALDVETDADYARFVVGDLVSEPYLAQIPMQQFHVNSGWQLAAETINFWSDALNEQLDRAIVEQFEPFVTTRRKVVLK